MRILKVARREWLSYSYQIKNRVREPEALRTLLRLTPEEERGLEATRGVYPTAITPYYLSLMDPEDPEDPVRRQAIPRAEEVDEKIQSAGDPDPFREEGDIPGLTHRYPDRVLLVVTSVCAVYCRFCMRKRIFAQGERSRSLQEIEAMLRYVAEHEEVREVLISGGDPLTLSNDKLALLLGRIRRIKHVELIRIGTRLPVTAPQRFFDEELLDILEKHAPLWISTHFNHPKELTELSAMAIDRLLRRGIPVVNQTVLLKGVNDDPRTMLELMRNLLRIKVKPQYLFHCDPVRGVMHFRTSLDRGMEVMEYLRGRISGIGIPTYALDLPGGRGKVPLQPGYLMGRHGNTFLFRDPRGEPVELTIDEVP